MIKPLSFSLYNSVLGIIPSSFLAHKKGHSNLPFKVEFLKPFRRCCFFFFFFVCFFFSQKCLKHLEGTEITEGEKEEITEGTGGTTG